MTELDPLPRYWVEGWSSYRAIAVLERTAPEDLNHIVAFMAVTLRTAYGQLRAEIEDKGGQKASWLHPGISLHYELPIAMTLGSLQKIQSQENLWSCEMTAVLDLFAGQVILEWNEDAKEFEPRFFDFGDQSPPKPASGSEIPPPFYSCHTSIRGFDRAGNAVDIGIEIELDPRRVIPHEGRTFGKLTVGLSFSSSNDHLLPQNWSKSEASAFWQSVFGIFEELRSRAIGNRFNSERSEIVRGRPAAGRLGVRRFVAKFVDGSGSDLFDKLSPPMLNQTPLAALAPHERGAGPRLDILDHTGGLHKLAPLQVFATMCFPGHDVAERGLRAACMARWEIGQAHHLFSRGSEENPELAFHWPEIIHTLAGEGMLSPASFREVATPPPNLDAELALRKARGPIAGQLLLQVLACSIHHRDHASLGKAVFLYIEELKIENKSKPKGERVNDNRTKIFDDWSRMRSVAHLWAAASLVDESGSENFGDSLPDFIHRLLATSEALRILGEHHWAPGPNDKRGPILDPSSTWRPPSSLELPVVDLTPGPLAEVALEKLRTYRADRGKSQKSNSRKQKA